MSEKFATVTASTHQIQFNNYLVEFIQKLREILTPQQDNKVNDNGQSQEPDFRRLLAKYYKYYRKFVHQDKRIDFIQEFVQYISKYNKEISTCDENLFSEESASYPR